VPEEKLPVILRRSTTTSRGIPPLSPARIGFAFSCPRCGKEGRREVETMDTFVDFVVVLPG